MEASELVVGVVECARLRIYREFLEKRGYRVAAPAPAGLAALVVCADHLVDPGVVAAATASAGPVLVLGAPAPAAWPNAASLRLPLLPLDLERRLQQALTPAGRRGQGHTVLLVEDDLTIAATVARGLTDQGLNVQTCHGWVDLATALQQRPDFILMDLNLPGLTGEKLGAIIASRRIPTAIYSAESAERLREAQRAMGALDAFPKDTPTAVIASRIRAHLRDAKSA